MNALIISLPAMIIGGLLALAGVMLGSRITARAMGGWFSPGPVAADALDEAGDTANKSHVSVVRSVRDIERDIGAGEEESYPVEPQSEKAPPFVLPVGGEVDDA